MRWPRQSGFDAVAEAQLQQSHYFAVAEAQLQQSGSITMPRVVGIDHVQLAMPIGEEARARAFYSGLLGIPEVPKPPEMARRGGCWFEAAGVKVHVGVEPDFRPAKKAHPALLVDDLPALQASLAAAGHETVPDTELESVARCFLTDPFGNRIELIQA